MTIDVRIRRLPLLVIACIVIGIVAHVALRDPAYVLAGPRTIDLLAELFLASLAVAGALLFENTFRSLLVFAAAISFLLEELASPAAPAGSTFALGLAATGLAWAFLAAAQVVHRHGASERLALLLFITGALATGPVAAVFWQPNRHGCADCPGNPFVILDSSSWSGSLARWGALVVLAGAVVATASIVRRPLAHLTSELSAVIAMVLGTASSLLPRVHQEVNGVPSPPARFVAGVSLATAAIALAFPDLQQKRRRAAIRRLASRIAAAPAPGRFEDELARAVNDPTLTVTFPISDGLLVDQEGRPVPDNGRAATTIMREGRHLATVFHAPDTFDDDGDVAALTRVAGLVIEHERARAEQKAQALELRASRRRLVEASDRERQRIEHDVHDGAQQQLVSLLLVVGNTPAAPSTGAALAGAEHHLQAAISELRTLTHGLFPSVLASEGLGPAIEDLELSSNTIVEILELPTRRAPPLVESTAYLAAALAVSSARTAIQLRIRTTDETVTVDARGASASESLEWQALRERIGALEGQLDTSRDGIRLTLPCVS